MTDREVITEYMRQIWKEYGHEGEPVFTQALRLLACESYNRQLRREIDWELEKNEIARYMEKAVSTLHSGDLMREGR